MEKLFLLSEILPDLVEAEDFGVLDPVLGVKMPGPFSVLSINWWKAREENNFRVI